MANAFDIVDCNTEAVATLSKIENLFPVVEQLGLLVDH